MSTGRYSIRKVTVLGGGTMGADIALLIIREGGLPVIIKEKDEVFADFVRKKIAARLESWRARNKIDSSRLAQLKSLITVTAEAGDLRGVDLVIEAVPEKLDLKRQILQEVDTLLPPEVIFASNTSSIPITDLARATTRPERFCGTHFFNPPTKMPLVEVIKSAATSQETIETIQRFIRASLKKDTILAQDVPGFLVNRVLGPHLFDGYVALEEFEVPTADLDEEARNFGWPMGPFTLSDFIGLDVILDIAPVLINAYPALVQESTLLKMMIESKRLGNKSGAGFYIYGASGVSPIEDVLKEKYPHRKKGVAAKDIYERMIAIFHNEAVRALQDGVASKDDIEKGMRLGLGYPQDKIGPLHFIDEVGADEFVKVLEANQKLYGPRFEPCRLLKEMAET